MKFLAKTHRILNFDQSFQFFASWSISVSVNKDSFSTMEDTETGQLIATAGYFEKHEVVWKVLSIHQCPEDKSCQRVHEWILGGIDINNDFQFRWWEFYLLCAVTASGVCSSSQCDSHLRANYSVGAWRRKKTRNELASRHWEFAKRRWI